MSNLTELQKLQRYFYGFVILYMITGAAAFVMGFFWLQQTGAPRDTVISREIEKAGTYLGAVVVATSLVGILGGTSPVRRKFFLVSFVWLIVLVMLAELGLGGMIWFKTLRMRSTFALQWTTLSGYGQCCGYYDMKTMVVSGLCTATSTYTGCEEKVSVFADGYLRKLYTSLFGFTVVNLFVFVSTVIVIQARNDEERYIRIGRKEGRMYKNSI
ncbi:phospholipid scramblase 1 [Dissophora ornata]|nr:phospholipid scramblase 1 [Dissophora ornata]